MRESEEIKKGLKKCYFPPQPCQGCPYYHLDDCADVLVKDAMDYIEQLEEQIAKRDNLLAVMGVSIPKED